MMQKLKNDALWCKSAKNLAICFIYEASINLWCDLTTLGSRLIDFIENVAWHQEDTPVAPAASSLNNYVYQPQAARHRKCSIGKNCRKFLKCRQMINYFSLGNKDGFFYKYISIYINYYYKVLAYFICTSQ